MSGEPAIPIGNLLGVLAPWKVDGTDSGRVSISIQSNGIVAHVQIKETAF
jgi:hypothetical protein